MRKFNYTGPVYPDEHYIVKRDEIFYSFKEMVDEGKYFTIFAPRQMGKTTFLKQTIDRLNEDTYYIGVNIDFERYIPFGEEKFYQVLKKDLYKALIERLESIECERIEEVKNIFKDKSVENNEDFYELIEVLGNIIPDKKIVLLIDEFDAVSIDITRGFLYTLRDMYIKRRSTRAFAIYSIGVVGVKNIAELNFGSQSPFNIAVQINIRSFTLSQVYELINQYIEESGRRFDEGVIEKIYEETGGQPFLVNRLCSLLVEKVACDRGKNISLSDLYQALKLLLNEGNTHFYSLRRNAEEHKEFMLKILFGRENIPFNRFDREQERLIMFGVTKEDVDGMVNVANPIYRRVLLGTFQGLANGLKDGFMANGREFKEFITPEGSIDMRKILIHFTEFIERVGIRLFDLSDRPREAVGQYLLMSYLDMFMRAVQGHSLIETPSGRGRLDILLLHGGKSYVVETKVWRGEVAFEYATEQVKRYAGTEHVHEGYLVFFDQRIKDRRYENKVWEMMFAKTKVLCFLIHI